MTKKELHYLSMYMASNTTDLYQAYRKPSEIKQSVFLRWKRRAIECGGYGFKIVSHTVTYLTFGWLNDTEEGTVLTVKTKNNTYKILLP